MKKIIWTAEAKLDILNIKRYVAFESSSRANDFIDRVFDEVEILRDFDMLGKEASELKKFDVREVIFENKYRMMYSVYDNKIIVRFIVHTSEDMRLKKLLE